MAHHQGPDLNPSSSMLNAARWRINHGSCTLTIYFTLITSLPLALNFLRGITAIQSKTSVLTRLSCQLGPASYKYTNRSGLPYFHSIHQILIQTPRSVNFAALAHHIYPNTHHAVQSTSYELDYNEERERGGRVRHSQMLDASL